MMLRSLRRSSSVLALSALAGCLGWDSGHSPALDGGADAGDGTTLVAPADSGAVADEAGSDADVEGPDAPSGDAAAPMREPDADAGAAGVDGGACSAASCSAATPCADAGAVFTCQGRYADYPLPVRHAGDPPVAQQFVVQGDTIVDGITGLTWQRRCTSGLLTRAAAEVRCAQLALDGHADFHLANLHELSTLWGADRALDLDLGLFVDCGAEVYHTATQASEEPGTHWIINGSLVLTRWGDDSLARGLCVRIAKPLADPPARRFVPFAVGDVLAHDRTTHLLWETFVAQTRAAVPYAEADAYCANLHLDSRTFRLPTSAELTSFVDYAQPPALRVPAAFVGPSDVFYWSRTRLASDAAQVGVVSPAGSAMGAPTATDTHAVRCVADE
jgi:hypothetical protein